MPQSSPPQVRAIKPPDNGYANGDPSLRPVFTFTPLTPDSVTACTLLDWLMDPASGVYDWVALSTWLLTQPGPATNPIDVVFSFVGTSDTVYFQLPGEPHGHQLAAFRISLPALPLAAIAATEVTP